MVDGNDDFSKLFTLYDIANREQINKDGAKSKTGGKRGEGSGDGSGDGDAGEGGVGGRRRQWDGSTIVGVGSRRRRRETSRANWMGVANCPHLSGPLLHKCR